MLLARRVRACPAHLVGALALFLFWAHRDAFANNGYRVVVVGPADADPVTREVLARVSGELEAGGFEIHIVNISRDADRRTTVETVGKDLEPAAAFAIFPGAPSASGGSTAEIWACDRLTGRATVQRLQVDPQNAEMSAAVLAVHAVELLKAILAERWVVDVADKARLSRPDREPSSRRSYVLTGFAVEGAAGLIAHRSGFASAWTPALSPSFGMRNGFAVRLCVLGVGEVLQVSNAAGIARLSQQMAVVEVVASFRRGNRVQPIAVIGAGTYRLGVSGIGAPGFLDRTDRSWAFVAGVGGGVAIRLWEHVAFLSDVQMLGFTPRAVVHLGGDTEVGKVGEPALLLTAGIAATL